jgi:ketose-bisphosphate aldolase
MTAQEAIRRAADRQTIIPAFNIPYLPMVKPVVQAIRDENSVAMVQVARLEWEKFESGSLAAVAEEYFKYCDPAHTLLHLDHVPVIDEDNKQVDGLPIIERALKVGYQSVMVDASRLPLAENIRATAAVAENAHAAGVAVEAELGAVAGHEGDGIWMDYETLFTTKKGFTDVEEAKRFASESGCDWLSVAAGSIHGAIAASTRKQKKPEARLDIAHIAALYEATGRMPLVLHGGSGIRQEHILEAIANGVAKINVATEIRQPYENALDEKPGDIENARQKVYERTRWVLHNFLKTTNNRAKLFD